jgi:hypothetical protein
VRLGAGAFALVVPPPATAAPPDVTTVLPFSITIEFSNMGGKLDVDDAGSGYENDILRLFTVIDCAAAMPVP